MKVLLLWLLLPFYTTALVENGLNVDSHFKTRSQRYTTQCGIFGSWSRCTRYRTIYYKDHVCKPGWSAHTNTRECPYAICNGLVNPTRACNGRYPNSHIVLKDGSTRYSGGGTCNTPEQCTGCKEGFYSAGNTCDMCSAIQNCNLETCTTSTNQLCTRCEGVVRELKGERAYAVTQDRRRCIQACSWRSDSRACYPGTCDQEHATSCVCSDGFSDKHCRTMDTPPTMSYNEIKVYGSALVPKSAPGNIILGSPQDMSWTNIQDVQKIKFYYKTNYKLPNPVLAKPAYIERFATGVVDVKATFKHERDTSILKTVERPCGNVNVKSPDQRGMECTEELNATQLLQLPVQNEDVFHFQFESENGGFVEVRNKETNSLDTFYYDGKTTTHSFSLTFDFINPWHCSVPIEVECPEDNCLLKTSICNESPSSLCLQDTRTCPQDTSSVCLDGIPMKVCFSTSSRRCFKEIPTCDKKMLTVPIASTKSPITVSWDGWQDNGPLWHYKPEVTELAVKDHSDSQAKLEGKSVVHPPFDEVQYGQSSTDISLTKPGAYSLVVSVFDKAGNHKSARRVFIYDATSKVETKFNTVLRPVSASPKADYIWQWTTQSVTFSWDQRYTNTLHHDNKWLNGVVDLKDVDEEYDDNGLSRGLDPIDNVLGVVEYQSAFLVDHSGGGTITSPPADQDFESQVLAQYQTIRPQLVDGDTVRFWIRAYDVRREYLEEEVTVHIDTSDPIIQNLWLTLGDRLNISVHNVHELDDLTIEWESYDDHSGLETVSWRLFDNFTGEDILHGNGNISPQGEMQTMDECNVKYVRGANCYCTPGVGCYYRHFQVQPIKKDNSVADGGVFHSKHRGVHDSGYFFEVEVMNKAKLVTKRDFKITIDTSAPHPGIVQDGSDDEPEADNQSSNTLNAGHRLLLLAFFVYYVNC